MKGKEYVYSYDLRIPLKCNTWNINTWEKDSEYVMNLEKALSWDIPYTVSYNYPNSANEDKIFSAQEKMRFEIANMPEECAGMKNMREREFSVSVTNVIANGEKEVLERVKTQIHKICLALSMAINCQNCNKHLFHPRVEPVFEKMESQKHEYAKYMSLYPTKESTEYIDENGNHILQIYLETAPIEIGCSCEIKIMGTFGSDEFNRFYNLEEEDKGQYLLEEFYAALGTEGLNSKCYHLLSMIEFVEKEYRYLLENDRLLSDDEVDQIMDAFGDAINFVPKEKRGRIVSGVKQQLMRYSVMGRDKIIVRILQKMGITNIQTAGGTVPINEENIHKYTEARNKLFHGHSVDQIERYVPELMDLCMKIIEYVCPSQNEN